MQAARSGNLKMVSALEGVDVSALARSPEDALVESVKNGKISLIFPRSSSSGTQAERHGAKNFFRLRSVAEDLLPQSVNRKYLRR